jgi:acetyl esterase
VIWLEPEAAELLRATAEAPYLFQMGPQRGRLELERLQASAAPPPRKDLDAEERSLPFGAAGRVSVRILRPQGQPAPMPVVLYVHGAGWVFGSAATHDRLARELAAEARAAVIFINYSLAPEAKYPVALEEIYAVALWASRHGLEHGLDPARLAIAGDSVGGNMAAAVTLLAKERGTPKIGLQLLFYPVTDSDFDTPSYRQFSEGCYLRRDAMRWFWDQYAPDPADRAKATASPLRASLEQLRGLPPALVLSAEMDVLRDEGEAYAAKLRQAGVRVSAARFLGTVHDFVMLNSLAGSASARAAMGLATGWLRRLQGASRP